MSNFIPNEIVTINDKNQSWTNNKIRSLIKNKTESIKNCFKSNNPVSIRHSEHMQDALRIILKFLSKSIIPNFLENYQLAKLIPNVTGPYQKFFLIAKKFSGYLP